jgi:hypothetical protein
MIAPFQNESETVSFGSFTIENRTDRVTAYGNVDLTRDKAGLELARRLRAVLDLVVQALENEPNLPDRVAPPETLDSVDNPFA